MRRPIYPPFHFKIIIIIIRGYRIFLAVDKNFKHVGSSSFTYSIIKIQNINPWKWTHPYQTHNKLHLATVQFETVP